VYVGRYNPGVVGVYTVDNPGVVEVYTVDNPGGVWTGITRVVYGRV